MTGSEFLRRVRRLARHRKWQVIWRPDRGKGSHGRLILNGRATTVRYLKDELSKGTLHAMLEQLGIGMEDLRGD
jgi:mRNA interferase HicA